MSPICRLVRIVSVVFVLQTGGALATKAQTINSAGLSSSGRLVMGNGTLWFLMQSGKDGPNKLYAIEPQTGKTKQTVSEPAGDRIVTVHGELCVIETAAHDIIAFADSDAAERWRYSPSSRYLMPLGVDQDNLYVFEGTLLAPQRAFFNDVEWHLAAIDLTSGTVRWKADAAVDPRGIIGDGIVVVTSPAGISAIETATGETRWTQPYPAEATMTFLHAQAGNRVIVEVDHTGVLALDAQTGRTVWQNPIVNHAFTFDGGVEFVTTDTIYGIYPFPENFTLERAHVAPYFVIALDSATGDERWRTLKEDFSLTGYEVSIQADTARAAVVNNGRAIALDRATGHLIWEQNAAGLAAVSDLGQTSVLLHSQIGTPAQATTIRALDPMAGDVMWTYTLDETLRERPIVEDGLVFALSGSTSASTSTVVSIEERSGRIRWQQSFSEKSESRTLLLPMLIIGAIAIVVIVARLRPKAHLQKNVAATGI